MSTPSSSSTSKTNIFANDGSFLERFKALEKEKQNQHDPSSTSPSLTLSKPDIVKDEKQSTKTALERRKALEERIRKRGKRKSSTDPDSNSQDIDSEVSKKSKRKDDGNNQDEIDEYLKEVRKLERSTLKDSGSGVRALVK